MSERLERNYNWQTALLRVSIRVAVVTIAAWIFCELYLLWRPDSLPNRSWFGLAFFALSAFIGAIVGGWSELARKRKERLADLRQFRARRGSTGD